MIGCSNNFILNPGRLTLQNRKLIQKWMVHSGHALLTPGSTREKPLNSGWSLDQVWAHLVLKESQTNHLPGTA